MGSTSLPKASAAEKGTFLLLTPEERLPLAVLALAGIVVAVFGFAPASPLRGSAGGDALSLVAAIAAAIAMWRTARREPDWAAARWAAAVSTLLVLFRAEVMVQAALTGSTRAPEAVSAALGLQAALLIGVLVGDVKQHVRQWFELAGDAALLTVLTGAALFYWLRDGALSADAAWGAAMATAVAGVCIIASAAWAILALWSPAPTHVFLFISSTTTTIAALAADHALRTDPSTGLPLTEGLGALALLVAVAVVVLAPRVDRDDGRGARPPALLGPWMLALALLGTAAIVTFSGLRAGFRPTLGETAVLGLVVLMVAGFRAFTQLVSMVKTKGQLEDTLADRDNYIAALHTASEELRRSEARHRRVLDAAVDGIVELDSDGRIVRANGAFCAMVALDEDRLIGRSWREAARMAGDRSGTLFELPATGEAALQREAGTVYLEARSSSIPTDPPGMLLLIRDVTPSKVAEQTIRQLFQFLQDRDEDRTRILQRTNAAIEIERNRIARDLHDGPVQGLSACYLSLEAARLMIESGDVGRAVQMLEEISGTLSEEAVNLRRVMSDLRPPVLEERGLVAAVRELCARLERELEVETSVEARADSRVPQDVETLGYRVVQEALSNVAKHAGAGRVRVRVEAVGGVLRVRVEDDGKGFNPNAAREFLRAGKVGLASMRERAELAGGTLVVHSESGQGTTVMATIPFDLLGSVPGKTTSTQAADAPVS